MNTHYDGLEVAKQVCSRLHGEKGLSFLANHPGVSPVEAVRIYLGMNDRDAAYRILAKGVDQDLILREIFRPTFEPEFDSYIRDYATSMGYGSSQTWKCRMHRDSLWRILARFISLWEDFDFFIPIPQGGLFLGALTNFFGYPTYPLEVHAHNRTCDETEAVWKRQPPSHAFSGKKVLILEDDIVQGGTVRRAIQEIQGIARPRKIAIATVFSSFRQEGKDFGNPREVIEALSRDGYRTHTNSRLKPSHVEALYKRYLSHQLNL